MMGDAALIADPAPSSPDVIAQDLRDLMLRLLLQVVEKRNPAVADLLAPRGSDPDP